MLNSCLVFFFVYAYEVVGQLQITFNPANGSIIEHRSGATNVTFQCAILNAQNDQVVTQWNINNFRGVIGARILLLAVPSVILGGTPTGQTIFTTYRDYAVFTRYNRDLHRATLFCGYPDSEIEDIFSGVFHLRVYGAAILLNLTDPVKYRNREQGFVMNLENVEGYPYPATFHWLKDSQGPLLNDSKRAFGYPNLVISTVDVSDSGRYSLTASNYFPGNPPELLGTSTGSFTLDVLYGPALTMGPIAQAVLDGHPLSLLCATNVLSNPRPIVTWTDPSGREISNNPRMTAVVDSSGVKLLFNNATVADNGTWICSIRVEGFDVLGPGGITSPSILIGEEIMSIDLLVIAPGKPANFSADAVGGTWIHFGWQLPKHPNIDRHIITTTRITQNIVTMDDTMSSVTSWNMTGLLPKVMYSFRVQAVAAAFGLEIMGLFSDVITVTTLVNVPTLSCHRAELDDKGNIFLQWTITHSGGEPITALSVDYAVRQGRITQVFLGPPIHVSDNAVSVPSEPGANYIFLITATNSAGSNAAECPAVSTEHVVTSVEVVPTEPTAVTDSIAVTSKGTILKTERLLLLTVVILLIHLAG